MRWSNAHSHKSLWYPTIHIIHKKSDSWKKAGYEALAFLRGVLLKK